jgi:hypothetical protein
MRYISLGFPRSAGPAFEKLGIWRSRSTAYITVLNQERSVQYDVADPERNLYGLVGDRILFRFIQELWIVEQEVFMLSEIENWGMILESMEGLVRMFVEGENYEYVIAPLGRLNGERKDVVCPRLEELRLTDIFFSVHRVLEIVRLRNEKGRRLRLLETRYERIYKETVNAMRQYVDEVRIVGTREKWRMSVGKKFCEYRHDQWRVLLAPYCSVSR